MLVGAAWTQYDVVVTPPEEPAGDNPRRQGLLEIAINLLGATDAMVALAAANAFTDYFVPRDPIATLEDNDILRHPRLSRLLRKRLYQIIDVSQR